jgi:hypothetical protein
MRRFNLFRITVEEAFRDNSLPWQLSTNDKQSHITAVVDTRMPTAASWQSRVNAKTGTKHADSKSPLHIVDTSILYTVESNPLSATAGTNV